MRLPLSEAQISNSMYDSLGTNLRAASYLVHTADALNAAKELSWCQPGQPDVTSPRVSRRRRFVGDL